MPGLDRGERDIAAGALRRPPDTRSRVPCRAGRLVATHRLMATGGHLTVPHLNGVPARHQMAFGIQTAARLGISLIEAGIADPGDWTQSERNAVEFIQRTLRRWVLRHGDAEISTEFDVALALVNDLEPYAEGQSDAAIVHKMFIVLEPESAGYVVLGPVLRELSAIHRRLPVTFFHLFTAALNRWVRVYDYRDAGERVETLRQWYEGDPEAEAVELPDVKSATPDYLQEWKPLSEATLEKLSEKIRDKRLQAILRGLLELNTASRRAHRPEIGPEASERLADSNPPLPALLAVFEKHDAIEGCFDEEAQGMMECPPEPNVIVPLEIADVEAVKTAFGTAAVVCDVLACASRVIKRIMANIG
jgi:hypothetical protein